MTESVGPLSPVPDVSTRPESRGTAVIRHEHSNRRSDIAESLAAHIQTVALRRGSKSQRQ